MRYCFAFTLAAFFVCLTLALQSTATDDDWTAETTEGLKEPLSSTETDFSFSTTFSPEEETSSLVPLEAYQTTEFDITNSTIADTDEYTYSDEIFWTTPETTLTAEESEKDTATTTTETLLTTKDSETKYSTSWQASKATSRVWPRMLARGIIEVRALSESILEIYWSTPLLATKAEKKFFAAINNERYCVLTKSTSTCQIGDLSTFTSYKVCLFDCENNLKPLAGQYVINIQLCTSIGCASAYTLTEFPTITDVMAQERTSIVVLWNPPNNLNGVEGYIASTNDGEKCIARDVEERSCEIVGIDDTLVTSVCVQTCNFTMNSQEPFCSTKDCVQLPLAPTNLKIIKKTDRQLTAGWQIPFHIDENYDRISYKLYAVLTAPSWNQTHATTMTEETFAVFSGLTPYTTFDLFVQTCNGTVRKICGFSSDSISDVTLPENGTIVSAMPYFNKSIVVGWVPPDDLNGVEGYIASTNVGDRCIARATDAKSCEILGIDAALIKAVCVQSCNFTLASDEPYCSRKDCAELPPVASHLSIFEKTDLKLAVSWEAPFGTDASEDGFAYILYAVSRSPVMDEVHDSGFLHQNYSWLSGLSPNTAYDVSVQTCNIADKKICGFNSESAADFTRLGAPTGLRIVTITSETAVFRWDYINEGYAPLRVLTVYAYKASDASRNLKYSCEQHDDQINARRGCLCDGLSPSTKYEAQAYVCSDPTYGCSLHAEPIVFTTNYVPIKEVHTRASSGSGFEVYWTAVPGATDYEATAQAVADPTDEKKCQADAGSTSCKISNLRAKTNYSVTVVAFSLDEDGNRVRGDPSLPIYIVTSAVIPATAIIIGILVPVLVLLIISLILIIVYRKRIPNLLRDLTAKVDEMDYSDDFDVKPAIDIVDACHNEAMERNEIQQNPMERQTNDFSGQIFSINPDVPRHAIREEYFIRPGYGYYEPVFPSELDLKNNFIDPMEAKKEAYHNNQKFLKGLKRKNSEDEEELKEDKSGLKETYIVYDAPPPVPKRRHRRST